ncbi:hypothetical protein AAHA92_03940 [Salvia divinorum]
MAAKSPVALLQKPQRHPDPPSQDTGRILSARSISSETKINDGRIVTASSYMLHNPSTQTRIRNPNRISRLFVAERKNHRRAEKGNHPRRNPVSPPPHSSFLS